MNFKCLKKKAKIPITRHIRNQLAIYVEDAWSINTQNDCSLDRISNFRFTLEGITYQVDVKAFL